MPRFFVSAESIHDGRAEIYGDDARHISRSLRMRIGEPLTICDGVGTDYNCVIEESFPERVVLKIRDSYDNFSEPPYRVTVFQALARGDKIDTVVQKSVEFGAARIVPFSSERCNVKLSASDGLKKAERWGRIAEEAAKQSGRGIIPSVSAPIGFDEAMRAANLYDLSLFCWERSSNPLGNAIRGASADTIAIIVGPEGGFSEQEAAAAENSGIVSVSLGSRILRTESAATFVLACVSYEMER